MAEDVERRKPSHQPPSKADGYTKRFGGPRALAGLVDKATRPAFAKRGFADARIAESWSLIVGEHLAKMSAPDRITYPGRERRGGTLHLAVLSGSLALELQHLESQLVERVNGFFGYGAVARIKVRQTLQLPEPPPPVKRPRALTADEERDLQDQMTAVTDEGLRARLENLGRLIRGRTKAG